MRTELIACFDYDRRPADRCLYSRCHSDVAYYLVPKDRVLLIAAHGEGVALETEIHGGIVVPDVGHVLGGRRR